MRVDYSIDSLIFPFVLIIVEFLFIYIGIIERYKISHLFAVSVKITSFNN